MEPDPQPAQNSSRAPGGPIQFISNTVAWVFGYRDVPRRNRITFRVDFQSQLLWAAMMTICQPKITQVIVREIMGCTSDTVQAVLFAAGSVGSIASFFWAWLASGRSTLRFIIIPSTLAGLFCMSVGLVPTDRPYLFTVLIIAMFLAYSGVTTVRSAVWHMSYHRAGVGNIVSRFQISGTIVAAVLAGLAGWLLTDRTHGFRHVIPLGPGASYRLMFVALGICGIIGGILCTRSPSRGEEGESERGSRTTILAGLKILQYDRAYRQFLGWMMVFGFGTMMSDTIMVPWMYKRFEDASSPIEIVLYLVLLPLVVQLVTMPFAGRLLDRTNPMRVRVWGAAMWAGSRGLLMVAAMTLSLPLLVVSQLLGGIGGGLGGVAWQLGHMHFARKDLVQHYMGLHVSATGLRGLVAPFLGMMLMRAFTLPAWLGGGYLAEGAVVFGLAMAMQIVGGFGFWWMDRHYKRLTPLGPDVEI
ncbi:MAG: MFS transporter [Phycisphaerae bacterium]|nr:MFS transporter [Phycisphaerae bacterium]